MTFFCRTAEQPINGRYGISIKALIGAFSVIVAAFVTVVVPCRIAFAATPMIAVGAGTACALDRYGSLRCWGGNGTGSLGDGTTVSKPSPVNITVLDGIAVSVAVGGSHACATVASGGLYCWGTNSSGQLGDGTTAQRLTPTLVPSLTSGVVSVATGFQHTCALISGGTVKCWGDNSSGQLGIGSSTNQQNPTSVTGLSGTVTSIAANGRQTCAVLDTGALQCWGFGTLGDGTTTARNIPTTIAGFATSVLQVAIGNAQICAQLADATLMCWGPNTSGAVGDGTTIARLTPTLVPSVSGAIKVSAGGGTCALVSGGAIKCWGSGARGELGNGTQQPSSPSPQIVVGMEVGAADVAVGNGNACAMTTGGGVRCWGTNNLGQLGQGVLPVQLTPKAVVGLNAGTASIAAGGLGACALDGASSLKCWGSRDFGSVGDGFTGPAPQPTPALVAVVGGGTSQVSKGFLHACALNTTGVVQCWGSNTYGELGDGTTTSRATPADVQGLGGAVAAVSAGQYFTCALTLSGGVKCWGQNNVGQLGRGTTSFVGAAPPADVSGLTSGVSAVYAGVGSACALLTTGAVKCWGQNNAGQLGDGSTTNRTSPVDVTGLSSGVASVAVGGGVTCALMSSGTVKCWGAGALGDGGAISASSNVPVDTLPLGDVATHIAARSHVCARLASGTVKCWGNANYSGELGDGTTVARTAPTAVVGLSGTVAAVSVGSSFSCGLMTAGGIECWGDNQYGQLGNGSTGFETTATRYALTPSLTSPLAVTDRAAVSATVDATLIARYLSGLSGVALTQGIDMTGALRADTTELARYLEAIRPLLDIDGNTEFNPLTDGLLVVRYLLGMRGSALVAGAVGNGATRSEAQIEAYLASLLP